MSNKKVYCLDCIFYDSNDFCNASPKKVEAFFLAPGHFIESRDPCHQKNRHNDCSDFKRKEEETK